jgi:hypothetical protein
MIPLITHMTLLEKVEKPSFYSELLWSLCYIFSVDSHIVRRKNKHVN